MRYSLPRFNRPLAVILITVTLDMVGIGLISPVIPDLLLELTGRTKVAGNIGYFISIYSLMQFIFSPVLGALSDRYGRRPVLLVSLAGAAVDYVIMAFAPSLWVLYVGRMIAGITGANLAVATAYIADISEESDRARRYGYMNACFGLGFVAGPLLGGLVGAYSTRYPFLCAALFNGLNFLLGYFVLPESHKARSADAPFRIPNPFGSLSAVFSIRPLVPFLTVFFIVYLVGQVPNTLWSIFTRDTFGWDSGMIGVSLGAFGILHAATQAFLTAPVARVLGELRTIAFALLVDAIGFALFGFITQGWMVFVIMFFLTTGGIAMPALQSLLSRQVDEDQQGELQGTLVSLMSLTAIFGPVLVSTIYDASPDWTGRVWLIGAVIYSLCFPILMLGPRLAGQPRPASPAGPDSPASPPLH